jgi:tetratricopeptide (TPR) repeat protein
MNIPKQPANRPPWMLLAPAAILLIAVVATVIAVSIMRGPSASNAAPGSPATWSAETRQKVAEQQEHAIDLMAHGGMKEARAVLADLVEQYPLDGRSHALYAQALFATRDIKAAYEHAARATELGAAKDSVYQFAGELAMKLGKFEEAREHFRTAVAIDGDAPQHRLRLASVLLRLNNNDEAQMQALQAIQLEPSLHQARGILAELAVRRGQLEQAIAQLRAAVSLTDRGTEPHTIYLLRQVQLMRRNNQPAEALAALQELGQRVRMDQRIVAEIAQCQLMLSRPGDAAQSWATLLKYQPTNATAAAEAAMSYRRAGDEEKMQEYYRIAQRLAPHHPIVLALSNSIEQEQETVHAEDEGGAAIPDGSVEQTAEGDDEAAPVTNTEAAETDTGPAPPAEQVEPQ